MPYTRRWFTVPIAAWRSQCDRASAARPKIHGYTGCKRTGCVKPGNVKLAMGHLLHGQADLETVLYKPLCHHGLRSPAPGPIHCVYDMLRNARVHRERTCVSGGACIGWSCWPGWPSLCHCSPPSLNPVHNCLLTKHVILHDFFMTCAMHGTWFSGLRLI